MRLVVCWHQNCDHIVSCLFRLCLSQTCPSDVQPRQLHYSGPQHTRIGLLRACQYLCKCPAFHVRGGAHWRPLARPGDAVGHHHAVSRRIHIVQAGLHCLIHKDRPLEHLNPCILEKIRIRSDPSRHDEQLTGQDACGSLHTGHFLCSEDLLSASSREDTDS